MNFQESTTILNACTKKSVNLLNAPCIYIFCFFHHTTCESTCNTLTSSAANQGDNTVLVAQGGTIYIYSTALSYQN